MDQEEDTAKVNPKDGSPLPKDSTSPTSPSNEVPEPEEDDVDPSDDDQPTIETNPESPGRTPLLDNDPKATPDREVQNLSP